MHLESKIMINEALKEVFADAAIEVLNRALKADPEAVQALIEYRHPCNNDMAHDPTIQCEEPISNTYRVGVLGLINGIIGVNERNWGLVCAVFEDGKIEKFIKSMEVACPAVRVEDTDATR